MSLDVYLTGEVVKVPCACHKCGNEHKYEELEEFFWSNITHNLSRMAKEAGIYKHLWRPEEIGIVNAFQLIEPLETGLALLKSDPSRFKAFNASNGWGLYEDFVLWVEEYLAACKEHPFANVHVSR